MIEKVMKKRPLSESSAKDDLEYWLSKTPEERVNAVDFLRRHYYGNLSRLERVLRVVKREQR